jgi:hypothetical protein
MLESRAKRKRNRDKSRNPPRVDPVRHYSVNTVAPFMKAIVAQLALDEEHDQQADGDSHGQPEQIYKRVDLLLPQVAKG